MHHISRETGHTTRDSLSSISDSESPVFCFFLSMVSVYRAMTSGERAAVLVAVSFTIVLNALSTAATNAASFLKTLEQIWVYFVCKSINLSTYSRGSYEVRVLPVSTCSVSSIILGLDCE